MSGSNQQLRIFRQPSAKPLFSEHFERDVLPDAPEYRQLDVDRLQHELRELWQAEQHGLAEANEAQTEERWIQPVLKLLGFHYTVQANVRFAGGRRQPDYALFIDDEARARADQADEAHRYELAVAVADAKRFDRPLDVRGRQAEDTGHPVAQIVNYVLITKRAWGVLTNGRLWRLYSAQSGISEGSCLEIDLVEAIETGEAALRAFAFFFAADAFAKDANGDSRLDRALDETTRNTVAVGERLKRSIFDAVPLVAEGLLGDDERSQANLALAFENSLIVLYRLLFCLHAEARGLLPLGNENFRPYSVSAHKQQIAQSLLTGKQFSGQASTIYDQLQALFQIVDQGDPFLDVTAYNGGLFAVDEHPWLTGRKVPDHLMSLALDMVCRVDDEFVDYRDLTVRHLGTIYEELLEYGLAEQGRHLALVPGPGRHETGSYFTPESVVRLIVRRTLDPLIDRASDEIRRLGLRGDEALNRLLDMRVLDPAMGSGHFLVEATDYLAQAVASDPSVDDDLDLDEVRRLVVERCVYGVDLNSLAVELARLSLWLTTAKVAEPLSFVQNVRCGNSLVGISLADLLTGGAQTLERSSMVDDLIAMLGNYREIVAIASHTTEEVHRKHDLARAAEEVRERLEEHPDDDIERLFKHSPTRPFHWELEFPEVFLDPETAEPRSGAGFDAVIGNPPYVRIQELGRELAAYCRERYECASGSFDVYVPFVERGLALLGDDGRMGYILPNKFLKLDYGSKLREMLAQRKLAEEIVDFGDAQVFAGATNYTCVMIASKSSSPVLDYRKLRDTGKAGLRDALTDPDGIDAEQFDVTGFDSGPWLLAAGDELRLLDRMRTGAATLGELAPQIFTGLQTSADPIYILEDRGTHGSMRRAYSKTLDREIELEPDLLHPLASGIDVDRYAFRPLRNLLLFPYKRNAGTGEMGLVTEAEMRRLPATWEYLQTNETVLRDREHGKMDREGWYAFGRTQSLGLHDQPKLGVPRLCDRLRCSLDEPGGTYLDNVDVNGIIPARVDDLFILSVLINSRALDYFFRRLSVPFRGDFLSANKQFIVPLPIKVPEGASRAELDALGRKLHTTAQAIGAERREFIDWVERVCGLRFASMEKTGAKGTRKLLAYELHEPSALLRELAKNGDKLQADPLSRAFGERFVKEHQTSSERIAELRAALNTSERAADTLVYELYELTTAQRELIEAEYAERESP